MRRTVASLALLALALGACSFRSPPDLAAPGTSPGAGRTGPDGSTSRLGAGGGADGGGPDAAGDPGGGGGTGSATGVPVDVQARPPRAGTYRYRVSDAAGRETGTIRLEITRAREAADGVLQDHDWDIGVVFTYLYRPDRLEVLAARSGVGECRFDPPVVSLRFPLRVGDAWRTDTRCAGPQTAAHEVHEGRVVRAETRAVVGGRVETVVVEKSITQFHDDGTSATEQQTHWMSPGHRLLVRRESRVPGDAASLATWALLAIDPA